MKIKKNFSLLIGCLILTSVIFNNCEKTPTNPEDNSFWMHTNCPSKKTISCLAINSNNKVFAGTDGDGIFCSTDNGKNWKKVSLENNYISCLAINSKGHIFAGTGNGIYRSIDNGENWEQTCQFNRNPRSIVINSDGQIFAVENDLDVLRSDNNGYDWIRIPLSWIVDNIYCLVISSGYIFAGTNNGVFYSTDNGKNWVQSGLTDIHIQCLAISSDDYVFAGTNNGVLFYSSDVYEQDELYDINVRCLAINSSGYIFAGANNRAYNPADNGVYYSTDNGKNWVQSGLTDIHIQCLAISSDDYVFAGTVNSGVFRSTESTRE